VTPDPSAWDGDIKTAAIDFFRGEILFKMFYDTKAISLRRLNVLGDYLTRLLNPRTNVTTNALLTGARARPAPRMVNCANGMNF
jgi:hypothetical protein